MSKFQRIIISLIIVIIVAAGAIWYASTRNAPQQQPATAPPTTTQPSSSSATPASVITYDGTSFALSNDKVPAGSSVKVVNQSAVELDFDSDPHPTHTGNKELNEGTITPGDSRTFTLTQKGTWGFHNHLNASQTGSITVE